MSLDQPYQYRNWQPDFQRLQDLWLERQFSPNPVEASLRTCLQSKYPGSNFLEHYIRRLMAAHLWLQRHLHDPDMSDLVVLGSPSASLHFRLLKALYRLFAPLSEELLEHDIGTHLVRKLAEEERLPPQSADENQSA